MRRRPLLLTSGINRRALLVGGGAGLGLLVAWSSWPRDYSASIAVARGEHAFGGYLKIGTDGHVTAIIPQIEMGQGSYTLLAQMLADELGADWRSVAIEPAGTNPSYENEMLARLWNQGTAVKLLDDVAHWGRKQFSRSGQMQITGGSTSLRAFELPMRQAGAAARAVLCMAAGARWDADWRACDTVEGFVVRGNDRARFGELVEDAARFEAPSDVPFRTGNENRLRGKSIPRLDLPAKVDGSPNYAGDVRHPDMVYAAIRMAPFGDGTLKAFNRAAILSQKGVKEIVSQQQWLAVIASNWWAANQALDKANPVFETDVTPPSSKSAHAALKAALKGDDRSVVETGDVTADLAAGKSWRAEYSADFAPHGALEPISATGLWRDGKLELWLCTQAAARAQAIAARSIGVSIADVIVHPMMLGGSFGRKYENEIAAQIAIIAKQVGKPVQLIWSRAQDTQADRFRPAAAAQLFARVEADGRLQAWRARIAAPATMTELRNRLFDDQSPAQAHRAAAMAHDDECLSGAIPPYAISSLSIRHHPVDLGVPTGKWRSGADSFTAFFTESFIDELSRKTGVEPYSFRMATLGNSPRLAKCLAQVTSRAGWQGGATGTQQGLACHAMQGSFIAIVAEAFVDDNQRIVVPRIYAAVDVGRMINPDIALQQIEGGILFGVAAAIGNRITIEQGSVRPVRFGDHGYPKLAETPELIIDIIGSKEAYGGTGEIGVPAVAPAIANAVFAGSGRRLRQLPLMPRNG